MNDGTDDGGPAQSGPERRFALSDAKCRGLLEAVPDATVVRLRARDVAERLAAYSADGQLETDLTWLWNDAGHIIQEVATAHFGDSTGKFQHSLYNCGVDEHWVHTIAQQGVEIHASMMSVPEFVAGRARYTSDLLSRLDQHFADRPADRVRALDTFFKGQCFARDIVLAQISLLVAHDAAEARGRQSELFEQRVAEVVNTTKRQSRTLTERTRTTSASARSMIVKTTEVAAAAEKSAVAMRNATQTAAGLIRAIEGARSDVELATGVAIRAGDQAEQAVEVSRALSEHVQAIESIVSLIRDIAGKTNLLALNATIEAARAGEAGRGFAVVAQEVKSLATQTARATDDIGTKINAVQQATRETVEANGSIQQTVDEVRSSTDRIRRVMDLQAQTVTMISAAVDETALSADSMSSTVAVIRSDTENVAHDIDEVELCFGRFTQQISGLLNSGHLDREGEIGGERPAR
ncbi:MAG: methyl-accepting chemotaxis protein [Sphingomicrobium sp.]